jgi:hypothetical protein
MNGINWTWINIALISLIAIYTYSSSRKFDSPKGLMNGLMNGPKGLMNGPKGPMNDQLGLNEEFTIQHKQDVIDTSIDRVKQANFYDDNDEIANFGSNVVDLSYFFNVQYQDNTTIPSDDMKRTAPTTSLALAQGLAQGAQDPLTNWSSSAQFDTFKPDTWQYKDEMVMNGGKVFGKVHGFSNSKNIYATNETKIDPNKPTGYIGTGISSNNRRICTPVLDDIRFGKGAYYKQNP